MFHHFFLVGLSLFLHIHQHPCASALIPSNKCIVHRNHDAQCKKFSLKSNIYIVADSSSSSSQDVEGNDTRATTSTVKRWTIQGLTCNGCVERVRSFVQELDEDAVVHLDPPMLEISDTWSYQDINHVLTDHDTNQHMYRVIPMISSPPTAATSATDIVVNTYSSGSHQTTREDVLTRLHSYLPLLSIFVGLLAVTGLWEMFLVSSNVLPSMVGKPLISSVETAKIMMDGGRSVYNGHIHRCMRHFMGLFFVTFSIFKLVHLSKFVDVFEKYDLVTKRWRWYGYLYPWLEITLGMLYLTYGMLSQGITLPSGVTYSVGTKFIALPWGWGLVTRAMLLWQIMNVSTMVLMGISSVGVFQALQKRQGLVCACLGVTPCMRLFITSFCPFKIYHFALLSFLVPTRYHVTLPTNMHLYRVTMWSIAGGSSIKLPMTIITLLENLLMMVMAGWMLRMV